MRRKTTLFSCIFLLIFSTINIQSHETNVPNQVINYPNQGNILSLSTYSASPYLSYSNTQFRISAAALTFLPIASNINFKTIIAIKSLNQKYIGDMALIFYSVDNPTSVLYYPLQIQPNSLIELDTSSIPGLPSDFEGGILLEATIPTYVTVKLVSLATYAAMMYSGISEPNVSSYLPQIMRNWNNYDTEIWIQNASSNTATVSIYFNPSQIGNQASITREIPPNSVSVFKQFDESQLGSIFLGSARIVSDFGIAAVVVEKNPLTNRLSVTNVSSIGSTHILVPVQQKKFDNWYTKTTIMNISGGSNSFDAYYYDLLGNFIWSDHQTMNANAVYEYDLVNNSHIPDGFDGSLEIFANQSIAAQSDWYNNANDFSDAYATSTGIPADLTTNSLIIPYAIRSTQNKQSTILSVRNASNPISNINISVYFYYPNGDLITEYNYDLPSLGGLRLSTEDITELGNDWIGFIIVVATGSLAVDVAHVVVIPCNQNQWYGQYFDNNDLLGSPGLLRCDTNIDFNWGTESPGNPIPKDDFSVRWIKNINIPTAGWYKFRAFTDDGLKLYLDRNLIINDWVTRSFDERDTTEFLTKGPHMIRMEYMEWSDDAMAYLNWYKCPNGNSDCDLLITPDYQTRYLDQAMPATCSTEPNQTIARWGCLITSISMNLRNFGIVTSPSELNQWLSGADPKNGKTPRGYKSTCNGSLIWDQVLEYVKDVHGVQLGWFKTNNAIDIIRNKGLPVIMSVANGGHYNLAVDVIEYNGQLSLGINDPHHAWSCQAIAASPGLPPKSVLQCSIGSLRHASTSSEETAVRGTSTPLTYLDYRSKSRTASLQFNIYGTDALLIDNLGRKLGYDPLTGYILSEIPNSFYYDSKITPPGDLPNTLIERVIYIPQDAAGIFRLIFVNSGNVVKESSENIEVYIIGYDEQYNPVELTLSPSEDAYQIDYRPGIGISASIMNMNYLPAITR